MAARDSAAPRADGACFDAPESSFDRSKEVCFGRRLAARRIRSGRSAKRPGAIATDRKPQLILIATGSEVSLALEAREQLQQDGIATRVVSMPCLELFEEQSQEYRDEVLPPSVDRAAVNRSRRRTGLGSLRGTEGRRDLPGSLWRVRAGRRGAEEPRLQCRECGEARAGFALYVLECRDQRFASITSLQGENMADVSIRPKPNGPYLVEGDVDIYDTAGNKIPPKAGRRLRCAGVAPHQTSLSVTARTAGSAFKPLRLLILRAPNRRRN